jgi:hypothetical protein
MRSKIKKRFYTPQFSEQACVSVRRLAWSFNKTMPKTIDFIIKLLPFFFTSETVCPACQDRKKCKVCAFNSSISLEQKQAFLDSL